MENFGSEIGQKMRSAVKAKLLELGTGGSAGYIDDELPDYVMIMVANKRSKQQMITDLNLFLGSQTELFVTWLHEVLQKLQEVTLPAATATAKKRKSNQKEEPNTKKDKKTNKKEKKAGQKKTGEDNDPTPTQMETEKQQKPEVASRRNSGQGGNSKVAGTTPVINSITDVFAEEFLGKAKKNLDVSVATAAQIKKGKMRKFNNEITPTTEVAEETNEFDIPTISEISSTTGGTTSGAGSGSDIIISGNRAKDLAELAEIRRKISAAKKHLKEIGELNDGIGSGDDEDDDEDILNMRDYADELNDEQKPDKKSATKTPKSPIIFETDDNKQPEKQSQPEPELEFDTEPKSPSKRRQLTPPSATRSARSESQVVERTMQSVEKREPATDNSRKRPVHERLGLKMSADSHEPTRERRSRPEQELYVPGFRRREADGNKDKEREVRHREADRNDRERDRDRGRMRERERQREREKDDLPSKKRSELDERRRRASPEKPTSTVVNEERRSMHAKSTIERGKRSADSENDDNEGLPQQRMGSHVIIAPPKVTEPSDDEDMKEKPVNSVIKIKPRPPMSPSKQACKNLLLRAMAEAQRSTILQKATMKKEPAVGGLKVTARLGQRRSKLSMRERIKQNVVSSSGAGGAGPSLLRRTTQNLVIEIESGSVKRSALRKRHERAFKLEPQDELMLAEHGEDADWNYMHSLKAAYNESDDEGDQSPEVVEYETQIKPNEIETESEVEDVTNNIESMKTQFVVTLNDDKAPGKYNSRTRSRSRNLSRSASPVPQVSSSSSAGRSNGAEASSTTSALAALSHGKESHSRSRNSHKVDIKSRLSLKSSASASSSPTAGMRHSSNSSPVSNTPPPPARRTEIIEMYRKSVKKLIIKNDSEDDELSPKKSVAAASFVAHSERPRSNDRSQQNEEEKQPRSTTPPMPPLPPSNKLREKRISKTPPLRSSPHKHKRTLIKFDLEKNAKRSSGDEHSSNRKRERRSRSLERERERERERDSSVERRSGEERRKISIRSSEAKKYDNIPSLSSMAMDSTSAKTPKPKERCKYHPNCTKQFCDFYHPTAPCKTFPNCKFADKCIYSHPKCMYDMACTNIDCNYSHSGARNPSLLQPTAPPLSSHVVPVQNYKTISAPAASSTMCKYYPNCTKASCTFYHPKPCRFGKNCINKLECNFYHHELQSSNKFKWVASVV